MPEPDAHTGRGRGAGVGAAIGAGADTATAAAAVAANTAITALTARRSKQTMIQKCFEGSLQSSVTCLSCGAESTTIDPFLDLSSSSKTKAAAVAAAAARRVRV